MELKTRFKIRRAYHEEKQLLKRTARSLALRFDTPSQWIEEILASTLYWQQSLLDRDKSYLNKNSILSDSDLISRFQPNLLEPLSIFGAHLTKSIFAVETPDAEENDINESTRNKLADRILSKSELERHAEIRENISLYRIIFETLPPPLPEGDEDISLTSLLRQFLGHLKSQKDAMVLYGGKSEKAFEPFPWFDVAFHTGMPVSRVTYQKGLIGVFPKIGAAKKIFKDKSEKKEFESIEQEKVLIAPIVEPSFKFISSVSGTGKNHGYQDRKSFFLGKPIEEMRDQEVSLRKGLFELRIKTVEFIIHFLEGVLSKEPVEELADYIRDNFSRVQFLAVTGDNPEYFFLSKEQIRQYRHLDRFLFHRLLRVATFLPMINDSRQISQFYKEIGPLFAYSDDVKGPHILNFSYYEAIDLVKKTRADSIATAFQSVMTVFHSMEIRASQLLRKSFRVDEVSPIDPQTQKSINSIAEKIGDRTDIIIPYLKEILTPRIDSSLPKKYGIFTENYREFHPANRSIEIIKFTKKQAKVIEVLSRALEETPDGLVRRLSLVDKIYEDKEAKLIRSKDGKRVKKVDGTESSYPYEWRLEKTVLKESHPAWKLGLVGMGDKIGNDKTYRLNLAFDSDVSIKKEAKMAPKRNKPKKKPSVN